MYRSQRPHHLAKPAVAVVGSSVLGRMPTSLAKAAVNKNGSNITKIGPLSLLWLKKKGNYELFPLLLAKPVQRPLLLPHPAKPRMQGTQHLLRLIGKVPREAPRKHGQKKKEK